MDFDYLLGSHCLGGRSDMPEVLQLGFLVLHPSVLLSTGCFVVTLLAQISSSRKELLLDRSFAFFQLCEKLVHLSSRCTQPNSPQPRVPTVNAAAAAAVTKVTPVKPTGPSKYFAHKQNVLLQRPPDYKAAKISQKNSKRFSSKFIAFQAKPDKIYLTYLPDQHA